MIDRLERCSQDVPTDDLESWRAKAEAALADHITNGHSVVTGLTNNLRLVRWGVMGRVEAREIFHALDTTIRTNWVFVTPENNIPYKPDFEEFADAFAELRDQARELL